MNKGYIVLWRQFLETSFFKDGDAVHLAIYLLLKANHANQKFLFNGKEIIVERGSCIVGRESISKATTMNSSLVYRKLKLLENIGFLHIKTNNKFSIVSIVKYKNYQNLKLRNEQHNEQQLNNKRTTSEQPANTNNTLEYTKNTLNTEEEVYNYYAKAIKAGAKVDSIKSIGKLLKSGIKKEELIARVDSYKKTLQGKTDKQFFIQANNFFGEQARYKDFEPVESKLKAADPNCSMCKGSGWVFNASKSGNEVCKCKIK